MIKINEVHLPLEYNDEMISKKICKELRISEKEILSISLFKRSIDARHKNNVCFSCTFDVTVNTNENKIVSRAKSSKINIAKKYSYEIPQLKKPFPRPVIIGAGPTGLFAALILAKGGANPILLERGSDVDARTNDVETFWKSGILNTDSNVQFGEGGAGTFSDGKLNTGTKDIRARAVLEFFVKYGAPEEILYNAKPHIGTDKLKATVKNLRNEIIKFGGTVMFNTAVTDIVIKENAVCAVCAKQNDSDLRIETNNVILAIGHSARDTFEMLYKKGLPITQKPFSVGARIEHLQENINKTQFGEFRNNKNLGAADYKLSTHLKNGRGVYTFCMCPGGQVVNASSENGHLVTNGMSRFARDGKNANSALLVSVGQDDFKSEHPLGGMFYQRKLEKAAFALGGENYNAPIQRLSDFLGNKKTSSLGDVTPTILPNGTFSNLNEILPSEISDSMKEGIICLDKKLCGFANGDAVLTGVETRSSSPIRILRNKELECVSVCGLYPCGEGAGYAGGIVSAAVDGIKCAEMVIAKANKDFSR